MSGDEWGEPIEGEKANRWKPDSIGSFLVGEVVRVEKGKYGEEASIRQEDGAVINTPGHAYLVPLVKKLVVGDRVKITVTGAKKGKQGGTGFIYEVRKSKQAKLPGSTPDQSQVDKIRTLLDRMDKSVKDGVTVTDGVLDTIGKEVYAPNEHRDAVQRLKDQGKIVQVKGGWLTT